MNDLSGKDVDRYHIIEQLGQGGMAVVYLAYDNRLERDVAIKVIRRNAFSPDVLDRVLKRFDREAKSLAKLTHPNIVSVIDYGEYEGSPYLVMPYLVGGTLKDYLGSPMNYQQAITILLPLADALAYAHKKGIVHRDVKPGNILITEGGDPMLTDFGIALLLESGDSQQLTATGMGVGTPEYMSPEQSIGHDVDGRTDIYSLGVVFYELVTGRRPYTADTPMAVILKQSNEPLPRPGQFVKDLPESVEKLIYKALAKKPEDRFQTMSEFQNALLDLRRNAATIPVLSNKKSLTVTNIENNNQTELTSDQGFTPSSTPIVQTKQNKSGEQVLEKKEPKLKKIYEKKKMIWVLSCIAFVFFSIGIFYLIVQTKKTNQQISSVAGTPISETKITEEKGTQIVKTQPSPNNWIEGKQLLIDDFEDGLSPDWKLNGFWEVVKDETGNSVLQREGSQVAGAEIGSRAWSDYSLKFRVKAFSYGSGPYKETFSIGFRSNCDNSCPEYSWNFHNTFQNLGRPSGTQWSQFMVADYNLPLNKWIEIQVDVTGNTLTGYVDGEKFFKVEDKSPYLKGNIRFVALEDAKIWIDDVEVTDLVIKSNETPTAKTIEKETPTLISIPLEIGSTQVSSKDGMTMVYVPAGDFIMGSPDGVGKDNEHPTHIVNLEAYWIDQTEVTNAMFSKFVDETAYKTDAEKLGSSYVFTGVDWKQISGVNWSHPQGIKSNVIGLEDFPL